MTSENFAVHMEATPKWWLRPALGLGIALGKVGLLNSKRAEDLAVRLVSRGYKVQRVE